MPENLPDTQQIQERTMEMVETAGAVEIRDDVQHKDAGEFLKSIVAVKREVVKTFADPKMKSYEAWKSIVAAEKRHKDPLDKAERIIKGKMGAYAQEIENRRREEQRKREEEARRVAEEARIREAEELEKQGRTEEAEQVISEDVPTVVPPAPEDNTKIENVSYRESWQYEITDPRAIPREYLMVDTKKIGQVVRAMKGETNIPGIKVFCTTTTAVRS